MEVSKKAKLHKLQELKIDLCKSTSPTEYSLRRGVIDIVCNTLYIDDALEIFEWLFDNQITQDVLFKDVFNTCDRDVGLFARALELALINLRSMDGVILTVTNSKSMTFLKSMCAKAKKIQPVKPFEELMQEFIDIL